LCGETSGAMDDTFASDPAAPGAAGQSSKSIPMLESAARKDGAIGLASIGYSMTLRAASSTS
jgi:hypothetical protein